MSDAPLLALVVVVVRAPAGAGCGVCPAAAVVRIYLDDDRAVWDRCATHWPGLPDVLQDRGHQLIEP